MILFACYAIALTSYFQVVDHAVTMLLVIAPAAADAAPSCLAAAKNKGGKQETVKIEKKKRKRSDGDDDGKEIGPIVAESEFGTGYARPFLQT